ncbi:MAG: TSUP family transporter [Actinomycetota bacterium]
MVFPISGVEASPLLPVVVGFLIATATTPAGVSGAFLLLPFQFSVLGFTSPGVTPTNLLFNVISTPGGIARFRAQGGLDVALAGRIIAGAIPGVIAGSVLRVTVLAGPGAFKVFVGVVLGLLGANLLLQARGRRAAGTRDTYVTRYVVALAAGAGLIGGIYGISGGSIIAPVLAGVFRLSVHRVAPAALLATLVTSVAGVISFQVLHLLGEPVQPDWALAALFGLGGAGGGYVGARLNRRAPEAFLRALLGSLALALAISYLAPAL